MPAAPNHGVWIEKQLGITAGQFRSKRGNLGLRDIWPSNYRRRDEKLRERGQEGIEPRGERVLGLVNVRNADYIVYGTVFIAWIAVMASSLKGLAE